MATLKDVKKDPNYIQCLDHGFVGLVDYMGSDKSIVQAARVSYGKGTKKISEDRGLIRYLFRHHHTTPIEMIEVKFHAKMPIFVARQWIRHRTANVNEYSARYSEMPDEFYLPELEDMAPQSKSNKQGREGELYDNEKIFMRNLIGSSSNNVYIQYKYLLEHDLSRELSRMVLSLNNYTEWYWKIDLHNLFHFLNLRLDAHAQKEIRVYAEAMYKMIKPLFPIACEAFEDYKLHAVNFSRMEMNLIKKLFKYADLDYCMEETDWKNELSKREFEEFKQKLDL